ncbi:hypothetical protein CAUPRSCDRAFT_9927 [Caulochytrium protostelioides]|uniref:Chloride channel protein n=1 Tax=Caulochytrium protostelioides TaxID=1555241 RepID=A0A4V1ITI9_9FUNG|nr:hypothetical protein CAUPRSCDRAFT_9927 [Caulochytrium protostelioides]
MPPVSLRNACQHGRDRCSRSLAVSAASAASADGGGDGVVDDDDDDDDDDGDDGDNGDDGDSTAATASETLLAPGAVASQSTSEAMIASFGITEEWILALIIGLVTGLVAAYIDVLVEWTTDIRQGYCARQFSASEAMCCLGMEEMGCPDWRPWFGARWTAVPFKYVVYTLLSMLFATLAATIVKGFAPHARGGGAAEVKTILGGVIMHEVLSFRTLVGKIVTLPLSIGSGLVLGKEASMIHLSAAIGHSLCWITPAIERSEVRKRAIIAVATAAGFASAFGSPIAGVMFVFEELATFFHGDSMILSFFAALISNVALQLIRPYRGRRTIYQVTYTRDWQWFELYPFALLGVFGGVMGMLFNRGFLHAKRLRSQPWFRVTPVVEAALMAFATAVISYPNVFMRGGNLNLLGHLFRECNEDDFSGLCSEGAWFSTVLSLTVALVLKTGLAIVTVGVQVPGGVFIPAMIYGGIFGRIVGICIEALSKAHPEWPLFDQCHPDKPCITPGIYGLLGAMAGLGGLTRLTVTLTVVMFELTGTLHYVVPCMVTLFVAKVTGDFFDPMPFSETQIESQNYPFLDPKLELNTGFDIGDVMTNVSDLVTLAAASPIPIEVLENLVDHTTLTGWPVIISPTDLTLVGYIYRGDLQRPAPASVDAIRPTWPPSPCRSRRRPPPRQP